MGMFDSVTFNCPRCRKAVEVQSKAGKCELAEHTSDAVPLAIAANIAGSHVWCEPCNERWTVVSINAPPTVVMRLA